MHRFFKILAAGLVLVLVILAIWYIWVPKKSEAPLAPTPPPVTSVEPPNFTRTGALVRNSPGLRPDTWYLLYEAAGQPALSTELLFNSQSECIFAGNVTLPCDVTKLAAGMRVYLEGFEQNELVAVRKLEAENMASSSASAR